MGIPWAFSNLSSGLALNLSFQVQVSRGIPAVRTCICTPASSCTRLFSPPPLLREMRLVHHSHQRRKTRRHAWPSTREVSIHIPEMPQGSLYFRQGAPTCSHGEHTGSGILNFFGLKAQASSLTLHCLFSHFSRWGIFPPTQVVMGCD